MKPTHCLKLAVYVLLLASASAALAQMPQPFSADFSAAGKNRTSVTGEIFFSLANYRMDVNARGQNVSLITNGGAKVSYVVMHAQHMYMEMKPGQTNPMAQNLPQIESSFDPKNPCASSQHSGATCKDLGPDSLNGRSCEKWLVTQKNGDTTTVWVDDKLHFPIKSQGSDGSTFEMTNIKEGAQPASLFEPPADYRKMDLGGLMGGRTPQ